GRRYATTCCVFVLGRVVSFDAGLVFVCRLRSRLFPYTTLFRSNRAQMYVFMKAMKIYCERNAKRDDLWAEFDVADAGMHMRSKRSEEHTSELQSREKLVCRLLLEKKKPRDLPPLRTFGRREDHT